MKRAELEKLGISKEQVDAIMSLHGQSVEEIRKVGETSAAEAARLQNELKEAGKAIQGFKALDVDGIKKAADEYKAKLEKSEADRAAERAQFERQTSAKEILASMKPKSELVKKAALSDLMAAMDDPKFKADKWTKEYAEANASDFGEEKKAGGMEHGGAPKGDDLASVRSAMGLKPAKKD